MTPTVSVVLCTYNGGSYLRSQLDSLRAQSHRIDELIVVDDASSDDTLAMLEADANDVASRVTIDRRDSNVGPAQNFSQALHCARGELVFLCDQDDVWAPRKVERVIEWFRRLPEVDLFQHDGALIGADGKQIAGSLYGRLGATRAEGADLFLQLLRRNLVPGCSIAARRPFLERALPVATGFMHDEWLALFAAAFGRLRQCDESLMSYRVHANNTLGLREIELRARVVRRLQEPGLPRAAKIQRLQTLKVRLGDSGDSPLQQCQTLLDDALAHLRTRQSLPPGFLSRAPAVFDEWRAGRYRRYGSGSLSALRDFLGN